MQKTKRVAILFSGNGSNLEAVARKIDDKKFCDTHIKVEIAISNNQNAYGIKRCQDLDIKYRVIDHRDFKSRDEFEEVILNLLEESKIDLVVLAGFMRILTPSFVSKFKCVNIHPSLLPLFKGANALRESFDSPMKVAGVTVHKVSMELDSGEILSQKCIEKIEDESFEEFSARIHALEHELYYRTILRLLVD